MYECDFNYFKVYLIPGENPLHPCIRVDAYGFTQDINKMDTFIYKTLPNHGTCSSAPVTRSYKHLG